MIPNNSLLLSISECAEALRVSKSFLYALAKAGVLPTVRIGHRLLVRRSDVQRFIQVGAPDARVRQLWLVKS